jgi:hypothetical protein
MSIRTIFSVGTIALLVLAVGLAGCGKKEEPKPVPVEQKAPPPAPAVASLTFAKGVDVNWAAVSPSSEFKPADRINVTIKTENAVPGSQLLVKWMYLGTNQLVKADSLVLKEAGVNNSAFYIERAKGFPPGDYEVDAYLNGVLAKSGSFKVVK